MKKLFVSVVLILAVILAATPNGGAINAFAAEDNSAPELKSVQVVDTTVEAGKSIAVKVKVKEAGTGLARAFIQFNNSEEDVNMLIADKEWSTPVYSSGEKYIEYTFYVPTEKSTRSGDWFIGYLEFYDQKGNFSRYCGNSADNKMVSEFLEPVQTLTGGSHVEIHGTTGDVERPILNWIKVANTSVDKPGKVLIQANITEKTGIGYVQLEVSKKDGTDGTMLQLYSLENSSGTKTYTFEVPISVARHNGEWMVSELYLDDVEGNPAHYTTALSTGYLTDYYDATREFDIPIFTVAGDTNDEVAPVLNSVKVLNDNSEIYKPGVLKLQIGLKDDTAVTNIEIEYECISSANLDAKSRVGYRFSAKGYSYNDNPVTTSFDTEEKIFDKPFMTGTHTFNVPIPATIQNGTYRVRVREMKDMYENTYWDGAKSGPVAEFIVSDEHDYGFEMAINNGNLLSEVKNMPDGAVGRILLNDNGTENVLTKEVLDSIAGQDKTLVCYKDGYQWIFDGKHIDKNKTKDLNLTTRIYAIPGKYLSSGKQALCLSFENNGELPGKVEFRFKSAFVKDFYGKAGELYLYHVEGSTGGFETDIDYVNSDYSQVPTGKANFKVVISEGDAWCYVDLYHNSKYVVSGEAIRKLNEEESKIVAKEIAKEIAEAKDATKDDDTEKTDVDKNSKVEKDDATKDNGVLRNVIIGVAMAAVVLILIIGLVLWKKRK